MATKVLRAPNRQIIRHYEYSNSNYDQYIFDCPNLLYISSYAFYNSSIPVLDLRNCTSLERIYGSAFKYCVKLTKIYFPKNLNFITNAAFSDCYSLSYVDIPNDSMLETVESYAFCACSITTFSIPSHMYRIGPGCFLFSQYMKEIKIIGSNSHFKVVDHILFNQNLDWIIYCPPAYESDHYKIPDSVVLIEPFAFAQSKIKRFTFPPHINFLFEGCFLYSAINEFVLNTDGKYLNISTNAFKQCTNLKIVDLSKCTLFHMIFDGAFTMCTSLTKVILPTQIDYIGVESFSYCTSLVDFIIPEDCRIQKIKSGCFFGDSSLTKFFISPFLVNFGGHCFSYTNLTYVTISKNNSCFMLINNTLFSTKKDAIFLFLFRSCPNVHTFKTSFPIHFFRETCFFGASTLTKIIIPETLTMIMSDAISHTSIVELILPPSIKTLSERCFAYNSKLQYISFSAPLDIIPKYCFEGCTRLRIINFNSFKFFRREVFKNCNQIECVYGGDKNRKELKKHLPHRVISTEKCAKIDGEILVY